MQKPIRKTPRMLAIEAKYKRPVDAVLRDLYASMGTIKAVADALGYDQGTIWMWMYKLEIPRRQWVIVPTEEEKVS